MHPQPRPGADTALPAPQDLGALLMPCDFGQTWRSIPFPAHSPCPHWGSGDVLGHQPNEPCTLPLVAGAVTVPSLGWLNGLTFKKPTQRALCVVLVLNVSATVSKNSTVSHSVSHGDRVSLRLGDLATA